MPDDKKLVKLYDTNLSDFPGMLRKLATSIEKKELGDVRAIALVVESDDGVTPIGLGNADAYRAVGLLHAGAFGIMLPR